ncbi:response regulator transcription factor [Coraliomargarita sp. SDUM461004]|uniref:Response regulator transcription factor n=1 Tax=Thalassobacterium sedimentorum TaxID=3041258 RepID=A0ABU1AL38_9BACT|nr:response regulator transcription factor [Coraliomargarita sp. SDUM461004]MDQ8195427.1 response regulator transcription factor [Coraliomargarita sp. SDUM461004]
MKALIVEDEKFVREYLSSLLQNEFDFDEIVQAVDGEAGWELFEQQSFQFIILDLLLPKLDGIQLAKRILERGRGHRVLAISSECDDFTVREVTRSGILGFVSKKDMSEGIMNQAFTEIFDGHVYYSSSVLEVLERVRNDPDAYYKVLSRRELQVLRYIAQRKTHEEIASELGLSDFTIKRHRHNAMKKLNLKNESSLLHFALDKGILKHKGGLDWS